MREMNTKRPNTVRSETLLTAQAMSGLLSNFSEMSDIEREAFLQRLDEKAPADMAIFFNSLSTYMEK